MSPPGRLRNHGARAADRLAIDAEHVRDGGRLAVGLGALEPESHVVDGGAMAVFQTVAAPLTVIVHAQFIAPVADEWSAARGETGDVGASGAVAPAPELATRRPW
jgi:hypothetical protein